MPAPTPMQGHVAHFLGPYGVIIAPTILFIIVIAESIWSWQRDKKKYQIRETAANTVIFVGYFASKVLLFGYQFAVLMLVSGLLPYHLPINFGTAILAFILIDFCFYWYHRISHEVKVFWAFHLTHHSSVAMNLSTAYRINWFSAIINPFFFIPAVLLGCDPGVILLSYQANLFYQFFMHTEVIGKIPLLEGIINTPSAHRVHHGSNPIYIDKNYGGVFMIWDRIFGTYQAETEPVVYGITTGFVSHNPFKIIFHGFVDLAKGKMDYKG